MHRPLERIAQRANDYRDHQLLAWLADPALSPRERLSKLVVAVSHVMLSFKDTNIEILRYRAAATEEERAINHHTAEDQGHWKLLVHDWELLCPLGADATGARALALLFGDAMDACRALTYRLNDIGRRAREPWQRFAVIEAIEVAGNILFSATSAVARELHAAEGIELRYFGSHHLGLETGHLMNQEESTVRLDEVALSAEDAATAGALVDEVYDALLAWLSALHEFVTQRHDGAVAAAARPGEAPPASRRAPILSAAAATG